MPEFPFLVERGKHIYSCKKPKVVLYKCLIWVKSSTLYFSNDFLFVQQCVMSMRKSENHVRD